MALPGTAAIPAVHADRLRAAEASGQARGRAGARADPAERRSSPQKSVENALRVLLAIGGSTNAIVHLTAIAGRAGIKIDLNRLNELSDSTPVLVDLKPTGQHYMSDLHAAGGVGAVLRELRAAAAPRLHDGHRRDAGRAPRRGDRRLGGPRGGARALQSRSHAAGRAGRAVRLARAQRRDPQALRRRPDAVRERRPRGGVHVARRPRGARRRPGRSTSSRTTSWCCRTPGPKSGYAHARGGLPADPAEARARRR